VGDWGNPVFVVRITERPRRTKNARRGYQSSFSSVIPVSEDLGSVFILDWIRIFDQSGLNVSSELKIEKMCDPKNSFDPINSLHSERNPE
jgi:hypothetical protein